GTGSVETFKPPYTGSANPGTVAAPPLTGSGTGSVETFKPPYTGSANPGTVAAPPLTGSGTGSAEGSGAAIDAFLKALLAGSSAK
ncbi:hypothetical protein, partial [Nocardia sp. NPDC057030]